MQAEYFLKHIKDAGIRFFAGVPDSQLKALCDLLYSETDNGVEHVVAANEGGAVGLAAGHFLATGSPAMVYMQNSGIGNAVNPIASLLHGQVYAIPVLFVVGWRGEPGYRDEPQHVFQGEITLPLLELLDIRSFVLSEDTTDSEFEEMLCQVRELLKSRKNAAFVVRKNALKSDVKAGYNNSFVLTREEAIRLIAQKAAPGDILVCTTGKASRELFEIRKASAENHCRDFLTVGSMGHASMIAAGIALETPALNVWCIDGDGACLMHMGNMAVMSQMKHSKIKHIILNNQAHETVGGMPVNQKKTNFYKLGQAMGYGRSFCVSTEEELSAALEDMVDMLQPCLLEVMVSLGSRKDLGRPDTSPIENGDELMEYLQGINK